MPSQVAGKLARVYAPKAHGAWTLQRVCVPMPLRMCTLFSSIAASLGGAGQANYAAANACLDALAAYRRAHGCTGASVQWGAWADVGMAARGVASERMARMEASSGMGRIGLAQGLSALDMATRCVAPSVLSVVPVVWSRFLFGAAAVRRPPRGAVYRAV